MTAERSLGQIGNEMSEQQHHHHDNGAYDDISTTTDFDLDGLMIDYFSSLPDSPTGGHRASYFHSPNGTRLDTTTPESSSFHSHNTTTVELSGAGVTSDSPEAWRLSNAVHMEVQENAKVATFNWNIDRSNSVSKTFGIPTEIHHYVTTSSNEKAETPAKSDSTSGISPSKQPKPSMEFFLGREGKRGRASFNPSYANTGIFKHDTTSSRFGTAVNISNNTNDLTVPFLPLTKPPISSSTPNITIKDTSTNATAVPVGGSTGTDFTVEDAAKLLELTRGIDPTPLSEIKRRHSPSGKPYTVTTFTNISNEENNTQQPSSSGFRFYVPKPSRPNPDSASKTMIPAATTPAAITTTTAPITNANANLSTGTVGAITTQTAGPNGSLSTSAVPSNVPMYQTAAATIKADRTSHFDNRSSRNRPTPLISNTGAIKNEAMQKSQYGFGTKHVVPSVPITKPAAALKPATKTARKSKGKEKLVTLAVPIHTTTTATPSVTSLSPHSHHSHPTSNGTTHVAAYERKKARAKNARILINESIDRLSVAMTLAGTQSKQRGEQIEQMKKERSSLPLFRQAASKNPGSQQPDPLNGVSKIIPLSQGDTNVRNTVGECIDIADNAKKWDRPSFIGSSASMIQAMNAQCESLMRELVACHTQNITILKHLHRLHRAQTVASISRSNSVVGDNDRRPKDEGIGTQGVVKHELDEDIGMTNNEHPAKKIRTCDESLEGLGAGEIEDINDDRNAVIGSVLKERTIMDNIVQYLDVQTKATCLLRVSKEWKCGLFFDTEPLWRDLCTERFGLFNVRQWQAKLEDIPHDNDPENQLYSPSSYLPRAVSPAFLYRSMDTAHVMPHYQRSTNMVFLGEGHIPGKIVAWTFLIERSNGETMRSVLRQPEPVNAANNKKYTAPYTSLPVVQLWTFVQNIAVAYDEPIIIREQTFTVDSSTRRRKDEMKEVEWDERFHKRILNLDGSLKVCDEVMSGDAQTESMGSKELCRLHLFDTVIVETNIHAKGCVTTSKFIQKSNYAKMIVQVPTMTTIPLVIPFPRDSAHLQFE